MLIVLRFWRELLLIILSGVIALGYNFWPAPSKPEVRTIEKEKVVTKTVIRTVTKLPDGTVIVKDENSSQVSQVKSDKATSMVKVPQYEAFVLLPVRASTASNKERKLLPEVGVGVRFGSSRFFGITSYDFNDKSVKAGVKIEF